MAIRCPKCGREYSVKPKFCGTCGSMFDDDTPSSRPKPGPKPFPHFAADPIGDWKRVNKMPEGIVLGIGEVIVKRYKIGRYAFRQGSISVIITNKRVIRYEESNWLGMQTNRIDEINIDAVHGTSCTMARSMSILGLAAAVILFIAGVIFVSQSGMFRDYYRYYNGISGTGFFGIASIAVSIIIIANSFRPTMCFHLHGAVGAPVLQTDVNVLGRIFGRNDSSIVFQFKPTAETTVMLKEIGACIYDLKVLGDKAIDKWK